MSTSNISREKRSRPVDDDARPLGEQKKAKRQRKARFPNNVFLKVKDCLFFHPRTDFKKALKLIKTCLENGDVDVNTKFPNSVEHENLTLLHQVCLIPKTNEIVKYLCEQPEINVNIKDDMGRTALCFCLSHIDDITQSDWDDEDEEDHDELVDVKLKLQYLIKAGADLDSPFTSSDDFKTNQDFLNHLEDERGISLDDN
jgi:hypothetical protein